MPTTCHSTKNTPVRGMTGRSMNAVCSSVSTADDETRSGPKRCSVASRRARAPVSFVLRQAVHTGPARTPASGSLRSVHLIHVQVSKAAGWQADPAQCVAAMPTTTVSEASVGDMAPSAARAAAIQAAVALCQPRRRNTAGAAAAAKAQGAAGITAEATALHSLAAMAAPSAQAASQSWLASLRALAAAVRKRPPKTAQRQRCFAPFA
mmetsp:Transcript_17089/g.53611  ORF Transcript_17089/g.53611 Transcript_17089/m.53611 type:complete len:208 (+) Transcript_17089:680-1303(+)